MLTKQEILLERTPRWRAVDKGTQENCSAATVARSLGFYGDGISFRVVFGQSF